MWQCYFSKAGTKNFQIIFHSSMCIEKEIVTSETIYMFFSAKLILLKGKKIYVFYKLFIRCRIRTLNWSLQCIYILKMWKCKILFVILHCRCLFIFLFIAGVTRLNSFVEVKINCTTFLMITLFLFSIYCD